MARNPCILSDSRRSPVDNDVIISASATDALSDSSDNASVRLFTDKSVSDVITLAKTAFFSPPTKTLPTLAGVLANHYYHLPDEFFDLNTAVDYSAVSVSQDSIIEFIKTTPQGNLVMTLFALILADDVMSEDSVEMKYHCYHRLLFPGVTDVSTDEVNNESIHRLLTKTDSNLIKTKIIDGPLGKLLRMVAPKQPAACLALCDLYLSVVDSHEYTGDLHLAYSFAKTAFNLKSRSGLTRLLSLYEMESFSVTGASKEEKAFFVGFEKDDREIMASLESLSTTDRGASSSASSNVLLPQFTRTGSDDASERLKTHFAKRFETVFKLRLQRTLNGADEAQAEYILTKFPDARLFSYHDDTTPFYIAAKLNLQNVVSFLLSKDIKPTANEPLEAPIVAAAKAGHWDLVKTIARAYQDEDGLAQYSETLRIAAKTNKVDVVKILMAAGANVLASSEPRRFQSLHWACLHNNIEMIKLIAPHADIFSPCLDSSEVEMGAMGFAAKQGHYDVVLLLAELYKKAFDADNTLNPREVLRMNQDTIRALDAAMASVPLRLDVIQSLLEKIDITYRDTSTGFDNSKELSSRLLTACKKENYADKKQVVELLIKHGVNPWHAATPDISHSVMKLESSL